MKNPLFALFLVLSSYLFAQNYQPLNYYFNGTPVYGIKIKTNIPFQHGIGMPTVMIEGFDYGGASAIDIKLNWYVYNNAFYRANASSSAAYAPEIKLANDGGKVSIYINDKKYYDRFSIRVYSNGKSETATMFSGWTAVDEPISGTNIKTVTYSNDFGNNVVIKSNGNLGIGTTSPTSKLTIDSGQTDLNMQGDGGVYGYGINVNTSGGWARNYSFSSNGTARAHIGAQGSNNSLTHLYFDTNATDAVGYDDPEMVIKSNGYVGIGTRNPDSKLTVAGKIHAREVKVAVDAGADFVFENEYKLPSLKSLEKFITKNKHLPEIASEKEMQENGIQLAEMNIKLLQKIEELTLYTIDQEKRIESLEQKNKKLVLLVKKLLDNIEK
ncbi:hypothetical protein MHTCC0001_14780 [Flavobacteriaceae bacterium MHTCC 0001]